MGPKSIISAVSAIAVFSVRGRNEGKRDVLIDALGEVKLERIEIKRTECDKLSCSNPGSLSSVDLIACCVAKIVDNYALDWRKQYLRLCCKHSVKVSAKVEVEGGNSIEKRCCKDHFGLLDAAQQEKCCKENFDGTSKTGKGFCCSTHPTPERKEYCCQRVFSALNDASKTECCDEVYDIGVSCSISGDCASDRNCCAQSFGRSEKRCCAGKSFIGLEEKCCEKFSYLEHDQHKICCEDYFDEDEQERFCRYI